MKKALIIVFISLCIAAGYLLAHFLPEYQDINALPEADRVIEVNDCDLAEGPCSFEQVTLEIINVPVKPLVRYQAILSLPFEVDEALLNLEMIGMDMGINRFSFVKRGNGEWQTELMVPVCSTGRRDWRASVLYRRGSGLERIDFRLSVEGI